MRLCPAKNQLKNFFLIFLIIVTVSPIMYFNGTQNILIKMPPNTKYQVEDVLIRFKTMKPVGLLFATTHKEGDTVEIGIFGGKIRLMVKISNREKVSNAVTRASYYFTNP